MSDRPVVPAEFSQEDAALLTLASSEYYGAMKIAAEKTRVADAANDESADANIAFDQAKNFGEAVIIRLHAKYGVKVSL